MKLQFGIIGLEQSGKTTVFNALCSTSASVGDYSSSKTANIAMVKVPDDRVEKIAEIFDSAKNTYAEIEFIDIAGMSAKAMKDKGDLDSLLKEGSYIQQLRMCQALFVVVRCFEDDARLFLLLSDVSRMKMYLIPKALLIRQAILSKWNQNLC